MKFSVPIPFAVLKLGIFFSALSLWGADWQQYRGPNLDGTTPERLSPWKGEPKSLWKVPTPNGFSSITISGQRAFTLVSREVEGVPHEICIALDARNGKELWSQVLGIAKYDHNGGNEGTASNRGGDGPRSTPTLSEGRVYVMSAQLVLYSFQAETGAVVWSKDLIKEHGGRNITWKNAASPVIDGGLVFVAGGGPGESLMALDQKSGQVVWKGEDDLMTHATPVVATIHGQRQVVFFTQKGLVSLNTKTGEPLWRYPFGFRISTAASPVIAGDIVYCSAGYGVGAGACKITRDGVKWEATEIWRKPNQLPNHWSTPVYYQGHLYGMFSFKEYGEGPLKCVELATGREVWSRPGFGAGNVILSGNKVIALSDEGELVLVEATPSGYNELARSKVLSGKCWSTPALAGGKIFVRSTTEGVCVEVPAEISQN